MPAGIPFFQNNFWRQKYIFCNANANANPDDDADAEMSMPRFPNDH